MILASLFLSLFLGAATPGGTTRVTAQESPSAESLGASVVKISTLSASVSLAGEGSGFFVDSQHVVTNWHVMQEVIKARVILVDGTFHDVSHVAASSRKWDLMLLKVDIPAEVAVPLSISADGSSTESAAELTTPICPQIRRAKTGRSRETLSSCSRVMGVASSQVLSSHSTPMITFTSDDAFA